MVLWMKKISFLLLLFYSFCLFGQDRYMVFFKDKAGTSHSLEEPLTYLSTRSLSRRNLNGFGVTAKDLPVSDMYIQALKDLQIPVFHQTKWMNGVLTQMDMSQSETVESLPFVANIEFVAPGAPLAAVPGEVKKHRATQFITQDEVSQLDQLTFIDAQEMHGLGVRGNGVWIAVIDDGFQSLSVLPEFQHLFQEQRVSDTFNFVKNQNQVENGFSHGLRVLSVLAASSDELIGVAHQANYSLYVTEALGEYRIEEYNWLFAAERADSVGVDIINSSVGYTVFDDATMNYDEADMDGETTVVTRAANWAAERGIVVVNSAGNTGNGTWSSVVAPSDSRNVLAVGAVNSNRSTASFSSPGFDRPSHFKPDVTTLGVGVKMVSANGQFVFQNGTSFSAPAVAGLVAGLKQAFPNLTSSELRNYTRQSGSLADAPDTLQGFGIPSFIRAMEAIVADREIADISFKAFPNPVNQNSLKVQLSEDLLGQQVVLELWSASGRLIKSKADRHVLSTNPIIFDMQEQPHGLYLLRVITASGSATQRIIK